MWRLPETICRALPQYALELVKSAHEWLVILRQSAQLLILHFQLCLSLTRQRKLIRENAKLRCLQINNVL